MDLIPITLTMSSREIAKLTKSDHDNVLKTVRALVEKGVVSGNETPYVHPQFSNWKQITRHQQEELQA
jgi:phage regulator Rha-like protein